MKKIMKNFIFPSTLVLLMVIFTFVELHAYDVNPELAQPHSINISYTPAYPVVGDLRVTNATAWTPATGLLVAQDNLFEYGWTNNFRLVCPSCHIKIPNIMVAELCGQGYVNCAYYWLRTVKQGGQNIYYFIDNLAACDSGMPDPGPGTTDAFVVETLGLSMTDHKTGDRGQGVVHRTLWHSGWHTYTGVVDTFEGKNAIGMLSMTSSHGNLGRGNLVRRADFYSDSYISLTKEMTGTNLEVGGICNVKLTMTNIGESNASGLIITEVLDDGFQLIPNSVKYDGMEIDAGYITRDQNTYTIDLSDLAGTLQGTRFGLTSGTGILTFDVQLTRPGTWKNQIRCDYYDTGYRTRAASNYYNYSNVVTVTVEEGSGYNIIVDNDGKGSATADISMATEGEVVTLEAIPNERHVFDYWEVLSGEANLSDINDPNATFEMPASDVEVKAHFKKLYDITVTTDGNGTGTASQTTAVAGENITLEAVSNSGFEFEKWIVEQGDVTFAIGEEYNPNASFAMPGEDVIIKAIFKEKVAKIHIQKKVANNKGGDSDVFIIELRESGNLLGSIVLAKDELSESMELDMKNKTSRTVEISEIIPMDYDTDFKVRVIDNEDASETSVSGNKVIVQPGDDITIVVENTFAPAGYFKGKDFVRNIFKS